MVPSLNLIDTDFFSDTYMHHSPALKLRYAVRTVYDCHPYTQLADVSMYVYLRNGH